MNWTRLVLLVTLVANLTGCGRRGYEGAERFPVSGSVTVDGEPMDLGTISFLPTTSGNRVSGGMIEDGKYAIPEAQGANTGSYRVEIRWGKKTGKHSFDPELKLDVEQRAEGLPAKYHKQSTLTADVSKANHAFDFELQSQ